MNDSPNRLPLFRTTGTNLLRAKSHNHRVVLEVVRTQGPLSRADIARITALSRQTVQNIVNELQDEGLLEIGANRKRKTRGHPGNDVFFRPDGAFTLGFHLSQFALTSVVCNLAGEIRWSDEQRVAQPSVHDAAALMARIVERARAGSGEGGQPRRLVGAGLAMPGPFGVTGMETGPTTLPDWPHPGAVDVISAAIGMPLVLENDAAAAAMGEHLFGSGAGLGTFVYLYFGVGLGAGLFLNGSIYCGSGNNAGEIGHMIVEMDGRPCPCGNRGCLERYVSLQAICEVLDLGPPTRDTIEVIAGLYDADDKRLLSWLDEATGRLRQTINILESAFDPETIIIGGTLPQALLGALKERLGALNISIAQRKARSAERILLGSSGSQATARGAAALAIQMHLAPNVDTLLI